MRYFFLLFVSMLFLSSCTTYNVVYKPTIVKPTFFSKKGDFEVGLNAARIGSLHGSYAVTDNIAVAGSFGWNEIKGDTILSSDETEFDINSTILQDLEIAIGYYKPIGKGFTIENYVGYSHAVSTNKTSTTDLSYKIKDKNTTNLGAYNRFFIQPAIGKVNENFDYGFVTRITHINYLKYNDSDIIIEPLIFTRFGYKRFKFLFEFGFYDVINYESDVYDYALARLKMGVGINYVFRK